MFIRSLIISVFLILHALVAHTPSAHKKEDTYIVGKPVITLFSKCSEDSSAETQAIYGHPAYIIQEKENGWALIETVDGYRAYGLMSGLIPDNPRWRTSQNLCRISSVAGLVYAFPETIDRKPLMRLPFDSRIELLEPYDSSEERWRKARLASGEEVWIQRGDIEKIAPKSLPEVVALSHKFLELPYIWGGNSSEGYDCSGFVHTLGKQMGLMLPRDSGPQARSKEVSVVDSPEEAGDLVFFGRTKSRIGHVGMYLQEGKYIHAGVWDHKPKISISVLEEAPCYLLATVRLKKPEFTSSISSVKESVFCQKDNPTSLEDLRIVSVKHWGFDGCVHDGELIVHHKVAQEVVSIFEELFEQKYPIEKMLLFDVYGEDTLSCEDNNTYGFASRNATLKNEWSYHSHGLAIDLNPLINPYKRDKTLLPVNGEEFLDRTLNCKGLITHEDPAYKAFTSRGWKWGGDWQEERGYVDYQHFYKEL